MAQFGLKISRVISGVPFFFLNYSVITQEGKVEVVGD